MLAIEVDGITHNDKFDFDMKRQETLERLGINFLRFQEKDVRNNLEGVVEVLKRWIKKNEYG